MQEGLGVSRMPGKNHNHHDHDHHDHHHHDHHHHALGVILTCVCRLTSLVLTPSKVWDHWGMGELAVL